MQIKGTKDVKGDFSSGQITFEIPKSVRDNKAADLGRAQVVAYLRQQGVPEAVINSYQLSPLGIEHQGDRRAITFNFSGPGITQQPSAAAIGTAGTTGGKMIQPAGFYAPNSTEEMSISSNCSTIRIGNRSYQLTYQRTVDSRSQGGSLYHEYGVAGKSGVTVSVYAKDNGKFDVVYQDTNIRGSMDLQTARASGLNLQPATGQVGGTI